MSRTLLPAADSSRAYAPLLRQATLWLPAMRAIGQRHGLVVSGLEPLSSGTHVVWAVGARHVIKLFAPFWPGDFAAERLCAEQLPAHASGLGVRVPELLAEGELEGWHYLVMPRLPGTPLAELWPRLPVSDRCAIAAAIGRLAVALARVPTPSFAPLAIDWQRFVADQSASAATRQRQHGLDEAWACAIEGFLKRHCSLAGEDPRRVLLHADLTEENLLSREEHGSLRLSAVLDFGDAMIGAPPYELVAPTVLMAGSEDGPQRAFLRAWGVPDGKLDATWARRLVVFLLLHRYADVAELLPRLPGPRPRTPEALAGRLRSPGSSA